MHLGVHHQRNRNSIGLQKADMKVLTHGLEGKRRREGELSSLVFTVESCK